MQKFRLRATFLAALIFIAGVAAAASADDPFERERTEFLRLYRAAQQGQDAGQKLSEALRAYPLFPYLQAARLRRAVTQGPDAGVDERVGQFLTQHGNEPVTRELRAAWLKSLASRGLWSQFLAHYADASADDALRCHSFTARLALERHDGLVEDIAKHWLTPRSVRECERAFDWLRAQGALSPALIEQRVRRAIAANNLAFARQLIARLPSEQARPLSQWIELLENPRKIDQYIANPNQALDSQMLLEGWKKLARRDRDDAIARFESLVKARGWSPRDASPFALALALPLAWDRRADEALHYFSLVDSADLDETALEWQARAALWAKDWSLVERTIAAMPAQQRGTARWRYWTARAAEALKKPELARQLYSSVLLDDNYYSAMAAGRLGEPVVPRLEKVLLDQTRLREIGQLPEFVRARELIRASMRPQATWEWLRGYELLPQEARSQAIHLAAQWGWYDQAVATATQQRIFNDYTLLYPQPYDREVQNAARMTSLPPELIYGLLRQESLYRADAVSSAGARGLLQLLPETARSTARAWKQPLPTTQDLLNPRVNVPLGAAQLRMLHDRFNGQTPVALAGYNAGPNAAARWLPPEAIDADIWVENIPYNETRTYVQRVLWHSLVFAWLRTGEPQRTETWVTRIERPKDRAAVAAERTAEG
jgi:soluble lytic murein transglycosylase